MRCRGTWAYGGGSSKRIVNDAEHTEPVHEDTVLRLTRLRGAAVGADESVRAVVEADWVPLPALVNGITENVYVTYGRSPEC